MRHELHLLVRGLRALGVGAAVLVAAGGLVAGRTGAATAALAVGVVAANHALAALSTGWARTLRIKVLAVGYAVFAVRMLALLVLFVVLQGVPWVHREVFAIAFGASVVVALGAECLSYVRHSYVPAWRLEGSR